MSRCFPYPPPNYQKADKSLIEPIKLQKEQEQAKERRKERKKDKKEKDKSKGEPEKSIHREHNHKRRKYDDRHDLPGMDGFHKFAAKDAMEQLEKSGLTEEHELPCSIQEPYGSPDSNQSISKSRKIESTTGARDGHGSTILRIRLPLQKHKSPEPTSANVVLSSTKTTSKVLEAIPAKKEVSFSRRTTSKVLEAIPAKKETSFSRRTTSKVQGTIPANKPTGASFWTASKVPETIQVDKKPCFSGRTASKVLEAVPANKQKSLSQRTTPKVLVAIPAKKETSFTLRTTSIHPEAIPAKKETSFSLRTTSKAPEAIQVKEPCFSGRAGSLVSEATPANEEPSFSGRVTEAPSEQELGKNAHARSSSRSKSSSKAQELESQFRNLIMNWKPSPLVLDSAPGEADESWLFGNSQQPHLSSDAKSCGLTSTSEDLKRGSDAACSFQPRACYLPEFDMYQLPYTIPF